MEHRTGLRIFLHGVPLAGLLVALGAAGCDGDGTGQGGSAGTSTSDTGGGGAGGTGTAGTGGAGGTGGSVVPVDHDCSPPEGSVPALKLTEIASGFERPILVKSAPGDNERLFVVEQTGKIWIVQNGQTSAQPCDPFVIST